MSRPVQLALRFVVGAIAILVIAAVFGPQSPTTSPYASALADLGPSPVLAAQCVQSSQCQGTICVDIAIRTDCRQSGNRCRNISQC